MLTRFTLPTALARPAVALGLGIMAALASSAHAAALSSATDSYDAMPAAECTPQTADVPAFSAARYDACKQTLDNYIAQYQQTSDSQKLYTAYQALAWLTYANYEQHMNSRAATKAQAWQSAYGLISALAYGTSSESVPADIPATSALMRPDLWAYVSALKDKGAIAIAPREMAFAEVSLIWAASKQCTRGWRQSTPHFRMAARYVSQANTAYRNRYPEDTAALLDLTQRYYHAYLPLDAKNDQCHGQILPKLPL
ncbi:hypothetical protein [Psychrobacter aestuarii]|nr:hypothetical protein [Psychrobacter aestuarii]